MSFGIWIRDKLLEAGSNGITIADLHSARKSLGIGLIDEATVYKGGTYNSFARYFHWFKQLGYVESVRTEPSTTKGRDDKPEEEYRDRHYYRISAKGRRAPLEKWADPIWAVHPEWTPTERKRRYRPSTGRPRGRPRKVISPPLP
jgi:hypothetical protein